jgi:hypothetical protein
MITMIASGKRAMRTLVSDFEVCQQTHLCGASLMHALALIKARPELKVYAETPVRWKLAESLHTRNVCT